MRYSTSHTIQSSFRIACLHVSLICKAVRGQRGQHRLSTHLMRVIVRLRGPPRRHEDGCLAASITRGSLAVQDGQQAAEMG